MHVARNMKVPHNTLRNWFHGERNPPPSQLRQEKRTELLDLINTELEAIFGAAPNARAHAAYRDLMTGAGILIDKRQLLSGESTENVQNRIVIEYADSEIDPTP